MTDDIATVTRYGVRCTNPDHWSGEEVLPERTFATSDEADELRSAADVAMQNNPMQLIAGLLGQPWEPCTYEVFPVLDPA